MPAHGLMDEGERFLRSKVPLTVYFDFHKLGFDHLVPFVQSFTCGWN